MIVKEIRPGFEKEVELLMEKKKSLEAEKSKAIEEAIQRVNSEFSERENTILSILKLVTVEVEIDDPAEEEAEVVEGVAEEVNSESEPEPQINASPLRPSSIPFN